MGVLRPGLGDPAPAGMRTATALLAIQHPTPMPHITTRPLHHDHREGVGTRSPLACARVRARGIGRRCRVPPRPGPIAMITARGEGYPRAGHFFACAREEEVGVRRRKVGVSGRRKMAPVGRCGRCGAARPLLLRCVSQSFVDPAEPGPHLCGAARITGSTTRGTVRKRRRRLGDRRVPGRSLSADGGRTVSSFVEGSGRGRAAGRRPVDAGTCRSGL